MTLIDISRVELGPEVEERVLEVLRSGQLTQGPMVSELERSFAERVETEHAVAVSSGTAALKAALSAIGVGPGDEVITTPFTFVATVNAILATGATVRLADIGADFNIDPERVEPLVGSATKAVIPVHLFGQPADMASLGELASARGLAVVEDAAQAIGAKLDGRPAGSFGLGCFSLYATKNVIAGEGGVVTTNDGRQADHIRMMRNQGMRERYQYEMPGDNWRLTDLQAAVAIPQLANLDRLSKARRTNAEYLRGSLEGIAGLDLPAEVTGRFHVFHQFTVRVGPKAALDRDRLSAELAAAGIGSGIYYPRAIPDYECYRSHPLVAPDPIPEARRAAREVLSLPVHPALDTDELAQIAATVRRLLA